MSTASSFIARTTIKAPDIEHRRKINFNIGKYNAAVPKGKQQFAELEKARMQAKNLKWEGIENLDTYLLQFEEKLTARGGRVIWAENAEQALQEILDYLLVKRLFVHAPVLFFSKIQNLKGPLPG
jgi:L-lactate dehydrogenase complex protein LldF